MSTPKIKSNGQWIPVNVAGEDIPSAIAAVVAQMQAEYDALNIGLVDEWGGPVESIPPKHVPCFGQNLSRTFYSALFDVICPILDIGVAGVSKDIQTSIYDHNLVVGDSVIFEDIGAGLPHGVSAGTVYYVKKVEGPQTFTIGDSRTVNPISGTVVNVSGNPVSASHYGYFRIRRCPHGVNSASTFNVPDRRGVTAVGRDNMGGTDAGRIGWANVPGIIAGVSTKDHTHGINNSVSRAAVGATSSDPLNISYYASNVVGGQYATVGAYGFSHGGWQTHSRGFNHHTPIYGATHGASNVNNMQPSTIAEFIIYTGV